MSRKKRILVFEDFESIISILLKHLEARDFEVVLARSMSEVMEQLNGTGFDMVIADNDIRQEATKQVVQFMRDTTSYLFTPIVLLITGTKEQFADSYGDSNIALYLTKPFDVRILNTVLDRMARK